jgi:hypothetical protein
MELNEAAMSTAGFGLPGQRESLAEQIAAETGPVESEEIAVGPVANPKRLRLGVPTLA